MTTKEKGANTQTSSLNKLGQLEMIYYEISYATNAGNPERAGYSYRDRS